MGYELSKQEFGELVERVIQDVPAPFDQYLQTIRIEVRGQPTPRMLRAARVGSGNTLLGLYVGRPQTRRSVEDSGYLPDVIYLFQREIERMCNSEEELATEVRRTLLHEIGHHFGLGEQELGKLGYR
jgi:predicted Zn-dependent protease with MMP-like domain